jgi:hypothetical protein
MSRSNRSRGLFTLAVILFVLAGAIWLVKIVAISVNWDFPLFLAGVVMFGFLAAGVRTLTASRSAKAAEDNRES